jgi:hypothetical protein
LDLATAFSDISDQPRGRSAPCCAVASHVRGSNGSGDIKGGRHVPAPALNRAMDSATRHGHDMDMM